MDLVGPLESTAQGRHYFLVGYTTQYLETLALLEISARSDVKELLCVISSLEIPKEVLTDQGTTFMSHILH